MMKNMTSPTLFSYLKLSLYSPILVNVLWRRYIPNLPWMNSQTSPWKYSSPWTSTNVLIFIGSIVIDIIELSLSCWFEHGVSVTRYLFDFVGWRVGKTSEALTEHLQNKPVFRQHEVPCWLGCFFRLQTTKTDYYVFDWVQCASKFHPLEENSNVYKKDCLASDL